MLERMFKTMDADGSGLISREESPAERKPPSVLEPSAASPGVGTKSDE